jgi:xylulokinase
VLLPHDWLTHQLRGGAGEPTTDRGDASGTGYWSAAEGAYRPEILRAAFGRDIAVPRVAGPREAVGETPGGILLAPGTGDNMGAALGLDLEPGDVVVSLGTSGTVFAVSDRPTADPSGIVAGFADATGRFLPLVCTLNAARVIGAALTMAGAGLDDLDRLALSVDDTEGLVLLPFLDGERTPALPDATGLLHGLTRHNATPAHLVRASVEGMLCGLADAVSPLEASGVTPRRIVLIGGAARSDAVRRSRRSTSRSAPPGRRPGRWPRTTRRRGGSRAPRSSSRTRRRPTTTPGCVRRTPRCWVVPSRCSAADGGTGSGPVVHVSLSSTTSAALSTASSTLSLASATAPLTLRTGLPTFSSTTFSATSSIT